MQRARGKGSRRSSLLRYRANLIVRVVLEEKYVAVPNESTRDEDGYRDAREACGREGVGGVCVLCSWGREKVKTEVVQHSLHTYNVVIY